MIFPLLRKNPLAPLLLPFLTKTVTRRTILYLYISVTIFPGKQSWYAASKSFFLGRNTRDATNKKFVFLMNILRSCQSYVMVDTGFYVEVCLGLGPEY